MYLGTSNLLWILCFGILLGGITAAELRGRPALRAWLLIVAATAGMLIGDVAATQILGEDASQFFWIRHPLQFVGAGLVLLVLVLASRRRETIRERAEASMSPIPSQTTRAPMATTP